MGDELSLDSYDYHLPPELIAQEPAPLRHHSRLLVLDRAAPAGTGPGHLQFADLPTLLGPQDLVVINDTEVLKARLSGSKLPGGAAVEVLLLAPLEACRWRAMLRRSRRFPPGSVLSLAEGRLTATVARRLETGQVVLDMDRGVDEVLSLMREYGSLPLPPYIKSAPADPGRYQTVYAARPGSVAAPTAGLHFTPQLLDQVAAASAGVVTVTLHVGDGTFRPVRSQVVSEHVMDREAFSVPVATAEAIARCRRAGGRVVAVGTTVVRTLESAAAAGQVHPGAGATELFIYPGYRFRAVDALLTNFHLPRSTLLMLVSAFAGRSRILAAYEEAAALGYRFYSFGDAMFIA